MPSADPEPAAAGRVAVVGAGALGCLYAARLADAGLETWLVDHRAATVAALRRRGIVLHEDGPPRHVAVHAARDPREVPPVALVVLLVKAPALPAAAAGARAFLAPDGWALACQNGLGHGEAVAAELGAGRVLHGLTYAGSVRVDLAEVRPVQDGPVVFGPLEPQPARSFAAAVAVLDRAGLGPRPVEDPRRAIWEKTAIASALNPATALLRVRLGELGTSPSAAALVETLLREAVAVAAAEGTALDGEALLTRLRGMCRRLGDTVPSMLQDVLAGRATEIESHSGAIVARGDAHGMDVPTHRTVLSLLRAIDQTVPGRLDRPT